MFARTSTTKISLLIILFFAFSACSRNFGVKEVVPTSRSNSPWSQGILVPGSENQNSTSSSNGATTFCALDVPTTFRQDQELRVVISSRAVARVEVSVNQGSFEALGTTNGTLAWPGNSFTAGEYNLAFRGVTSNGSVIACDPASKVVTIQSTGTTTPSPTNPQPSPVNPQPSPTNPQPQPAPVPGANSFVSLHQSPITYVKSSALDASGNLVFIRTNPLIGFKDQFAPTGTPGCAMGYPEYRAECQTVNGGFGFAFEGVTSYSEFRVFIPAGTTFFGASGYLPQSVQYAVAVRLGNKPTRVNALSEAEYQHAKESQNRNTDFAKLLAGEERLIVHDGGGAISLSGIARMAASPMARGQWIYFRVLNGSNIHGLGAIYEVNLDMYKREYYQIPFSTSGDPL